MIKLRADWYQACTCCGTEVVIDFLNGCPRESICPWCGNVIAIDAGGYDSETKEKLAAVLSSLEEQFNAR